MRTKKNTTVVPDTEINDNTATTRNYHQSRVDGKDQTVLIDPRITAETDEIDPEDDDDQFPTREDLEEDDYDLNHDQDDDLSLNIDDEELN